MSTSTLLVTIRGPFNMIDLELPGDVPVGELIPLLLEICIPQKKELKTGILYVEGISTPLPLERTLTGAGIRDGAVLMLQANHFSSAQPERPTARNSRTTGKARRVY